MILGASLVRSRGSMQPRRVRPKQPALHQRDGTSTAHHALVCFSTDDTEDDVNSERRPFALAGGNFHEHAGERVADEVEDKTDDRADGTGGEWFEAVDDGRDDETIKRGDDEVER